MTYQAVVGRAAVGGGTLVIDELAPLAEALADAWEIIVYNDDVNTFQHVIKAFVEVLEVTPEAAERKAREIHTNLKASVWYGGRDDCERRAELLRSVYKIDAVATG